jgi:P4 family phage/plasmid primase-like protien
MNNSPIKIKQNLIKSYDKQGYRILEIPINLDDPKALKRKGWTTEKTNLNIGKDNLFAVVQDDNKIVLDIDNPELNFILESFLDKTLVVKTGNDGNHGYFKDITRVKPIKTTFLYKDGNPVGEIRTNGVYVIGCGCSYEENGKTKTYSQISKTDKVLEIDFKEILLILKQNGITTKKQTTKTKFEDGLKEGERNNECFKTACNLFEKENLDFESGLSFIKTWNNMSKNPLHDSEVKTVVKSAWNKIDKKEIVFSGKDRIDNVAKFLQEKNTFVTIKKIEEILLYNGRIYDGLKAESLIKEQTEKLIPQCTSNDVNEVINKIKRQTFTDIENFDSDPNLITVLNGILNLETLKLTKHTPEYLSRVLLPVEYNKPKSDDIEKNLKNTMFWKYLKSSFTINGKFKKNEFDTVLEIIASPIVKRHIDEKAFMFLGNGENGKSVCLGYIESLLGENNISSITLQDIAENKFLRANLSGKSANIFSDLEKNELRFSGKIKAIISGEGIEVERKYQQGIRIKPFAKLLFSSNRFPKSFDQSQGFFRRWMIVKWERNFENDPERIPYLREKLQDNQEEKNLVFSCLVSTSNRLNKTGRFTHTKNWKYIQKEWNENADPIDDFATNYTTDSEEAKSKRETYLFYKEICYQKGETPLGIGQFSKAFSEYYDEDKTSSKRQWLNIDFRKPKQEILKDTDS